MSVHDDLAYTRVRTVGRRSVLAGAAAAALGTTLVAAPAEAATVRLDVRDFGARPDGKTDSTAAFGRAISEAKRRIRNSLLGLTVVDIVVTGGAGAYLVGPLTIPSKVRLLGAGTSPIIRANRSGTRWISTATSSKQNGIALLTLRTGGLISGAAVTVDSSTNGFTLDRVTLIGDGVNPPDAGVASVNGVRNLVVTGCAISYCSVGVRLSSNPYNTQIVSTRISSWTERGIWVRSGVNAAELLLIQGCTVVAPRKGGRVRQPIQVNGDDAELIRGVKVIGNTVTGLGTDYRDPVTPGTADNISLHRCTDFLVQGNTVSGGGDVGITIARQSTNGVVENNVCTNNGSAGISVGSVDSVHVTGITVRGNRCLNNGRSHDEDVTPDRCRTGINVANGRTITVTGNRSGNDGTTTVRHQLYGLSMIGSSGVTIDGNDFSGNVRAQIYRA